MEKSDNCGVKDNPNLPRDQVDGNKMSRKKGVRVTGKQTVPLDWDRRRPAGMQSYVISPRPTEDSAVISVGPPRPPPAPLRWVEQPGADNTPFGDEGWSGGGSRGRVEWTAGGAGGRASCSETGVSRKTMEELKGLLQGNPHLGARGRDDYTYFSPTRVEGQPDSRQDQVPQRSFTTFRPQAEASRRGLRPRESSSPPHGSSSLESSGSSKSDVTASRAGGVESPAPQHAHWGLTWSSPADSLRENAGPDPNGSQSFVQALEHIKQQIAREEISFIRFEATDLHGVSRSKTVPVRFFHEKAVCGVPMPRSYLELTLSPRDSEVDHGAGGATSYSGDILLVPDLATFRPLPWSEETARLICDPCSATGVPLRTSPRLVAKQQLGQLRSLGFSLRSAFTYECCVLGAPERLGPKTLLFPGTTLAGNHDLPFFQQLVTGMYGAGVDVDSFASASGPGQMEVALRPEFGVAAADSAFTFRTGLKEMARKSGCLASFCADEGGANAGVLSHSVWDAHGRRSLFQSAAGATELSELGRKWVAGLLQHSAALSCLMAPGGGCRGRLAQEARGVKGNGGVTPPPHATCGFNDNSAVFNVKCHGGREVHVDNKLGSATANPYVVLAATVAAGLDGVKRNLSGEGGANRSPPRQRKFGIPVKLEDGLAALAEDQVVRGALGEPFIQYFIALKKFEMETRELDEERNKCLEYFI